MRTFPRLLGLLLLSLLLVPMTGCAGNGASTQPVVLTPAEVSTGIELATVGYIVLSRDVANAHASGQLTGASYDGAVAGLAALQNFLTSATTANNAGDTITANAAVSAFNAALASFTSSYLGIPAATQPG